jgi:hypothetical protein
MISQMNWLYTDALSPPKWLSAVIEFGSEIFVNKVNKVSTKLPSSSGTNHQTLCSIYNESLNDGRAFHVSIDDEPSE